MPAHTPSGGANPYDFITTPGASTKKSLFEGMSKLRMVGLAAAVLVVLFGGLSLFSGGDSLKKDYTTLLQQQAEILRITDAGLKTARSTAGKNFAMTTKESIYSQQIALTKQAASSAKVKLKPKVLAAGKSADTDKKLTSADQNNQYDEVLVTVLKDNLKQYQQTLKKIYDQTHKTADKTALDEAYAGVQVLVDLPTQDIKSGTTDGTPATN